jgi:hypothetical protein
VSIPVLIPRRAGDEWRDRVYEVVKDHWSESPFEVVEAHDDEGHFNRSAAINKAARLAGDWDVAVIADADTTVDLDQVEQGVKQARETGRLVLPFTVRCLLGRSGTQRILEGKTGPWERYVKARQVPSDAYEYISGCQVIPRELWDTVGGFDERFEGWGGEDDAFHAACTALSGCDARRDRIEGNAWHLWHPISPAASHATTTWKMAKHLSDRYIAATYDGETMERILAEDRGPDQIVVVCLTTGTRDCLRDTIASADKQLRGAIGRKLLCVDAEQADLDFPGWDAEVMGRSQGYVRATRSAQFHAIGSGQPWVFWLEDDFTFDGPVDLDEMRRLMEGHPELAQLSLKRQPWYPEELEAGDMLGWRPEGTFTERDGYIEHRAYWTTNPMLVRRQFLAEYDWPDAPNSERRFGRQIFRKPGLFGGIVGTLNDPPRCTHTGGERAGHGY